MDNFAERQELLSHLKKLVAANSVKQKQYQKETNSSDEVGFLTRELTIIASYVPQMERLGITFDDIK